MRTEIIFFDAAGTLFDLEHSVGWHYAQVGERFGLRLEPAALDKAFRKAWVRSPSPLVQDGPRPDDDLGWWRSLVQDVCEQVQTPFQEEFFTAVFAHFTSPGVWKLFPETKEVLETLSQETRLGIISNFDRRLFPILENLEIRQFFDPIVISSQVGADKPHPQIFLQALALAGVGPEGAIHIGDDPEADWQGARSSGLRAMELKRPDNDLRMLLR